MRSVMTSVISWLEAIVSAIPLPLLEVWGRFSYIVGLALAFCAFGGFTFRVGERWGFGRERQTWDAKAFLTRSCPPCHREPAMKPEIPPPSSRAFATGLGQGRPARRHDEEQSR